MDFTAGVASLQEDKATYWLSELRKEGVVGPEVTQLKEKEIILKARSVGLQKIVAVMEQDIPKE